MEDNCSLLLCSPFRPFRPWGWGYRSIWSSDLSVQFKSVHCSNFRNEEENIQSFWSCPTTSSYPLLLPFSSGFCAFQNQGRNVDSMATSKQDTSIHLAHEQQCLPWLHYLVRSLPHLTFFVYTNICFHNHGLCQFLQLELQSLNSLWDPNPNFLLTGLYTLPKHCQERKRTEILSCLHCAIVRSLEPWVSVPIGTDLDSP